MRLAPRASLVLAACLLLAAFASFALSTVNAYSSALLRSAAVTVVLSGWLVNQALGGMGGCRVGLSALALALGLGALSSCDESERDRARLGQHLYVLRLSPIRAVRRAIAWKNVVHSASLAAGSTRPLPRAPGNRRPSRWWLMSTLERSP